MDVLKYMAEHGHEQLVVCSEPCVGLRAFIAIHDTTPWARLWEEPGSGPT